MVKDHAPVGELSVLMSVHRLHVANGLEVLYIVGEALGGHAGVPSHPLAHMLLESRGTVKNEE